LVESSSPNVLSVPDDRTTRLVKHALHEIGRTYDGSDVDVLSITASQLAVVLPNCERRQAVALANEVMDHVASLADGDDASQAVHTATLSAGVATVAAVPKNFDPWRLVESAEKCLYAARSCNTSAVKSIEI